MIYFIQEGDNGPVKIGFSNDPGRRLQQLKTGSSKPLKLLAVIEGDANKEKELHASFQEFHISGEWFKPVTEIFLYISSMAPGTFKIVECPVCEMQYLPNVAEDVQAHTERHALILKGALPYSVRELMKEYGWVQARDGVHRGKLAIAFAWWARDREVGLPDADFEDYMLHQLEYLDATLSGDHKKADKVYAAIKKNGASTGKVSFPKH